MLASCSLRGKRLFVSLSLPSRHGLLLLRRPLPHACRRNRLSIGVWRRALFAAFRLEPLMALRCSSWLQGSGIPRASHAGLLSYCPEHPLLITVKKVYRFFIDIDFARFQ